MAKGHAELHILTEYAPFSMGFVIITKEDRAIIIDGGTPHELHNVEDHVGDREVAAWIITHPHPDHIGCLIYAMRKGSPILKRVKRFVCNFHSPEFFKACGGECVADVDKFRRYTSENAYRVDSPLAGDVMDIDGLHFEFLFSKDEKYTKNYVNDSSLVFRVTGNKRNVLFLGDLGPIAGDDLLAMHGDHLRSDIVQMAHHGHMCVHKEVYEAIDPNACIWCCASWLYNEPDKLISEDMYGVGHTRKWMAEIGHQTHYVTKDGDQIIDI